jgi:hypothetical protein
MSQANLSLVSLPKTGKQRKAAKAKQPMSARMRRRIKLQHGTAGLLGAVASAMTLVSLSHIAAGIGHVTHGVIPEWQSWSLAAGLDINYLGMELGALVAAWQHVRDRLHRFTRFGIPCVMLFSQAMNSFEFSLGATTAWELAAGIAMGLVLPALTFLTFRIAATLADV